MESTMAVVIQCDANQSSVWPFVEHDLQRAMPTASMPKPQ